MSKKLYTSYYNDTTNTAATNVQHSLTFLPQIFLGSFASSSFASSSDGTLSLLLDSSIELEFSLSLEIGKSSRGKVCPCLLSLCSLPTSCSSELSSSSETSVSELLLTCGHLSTFRSCTATRVTAPSISHFTRHH